VLEAAREIVTADGLDALQVADVARRADVGMGTIYLRFGDRAGLLRAVQSREALAMRDESLARLEKLATSARSGREVVEGAVAAIIGVFRAHEAAIGQLMALAARDPLMRERGTAAVHPAARAFVAVVSKVVRAPGVEPEVVADMIFRMTYDCCAHRVTFGPSVESPRRVSWRALETQLCRMAVAYADPAEAVEQTPRTPRKVKES
jgi:AcrR family transcriptional regulator